MRLYVCARVLFYERIEKLAQILIVCLNISSVFVLDESSEMSPKSTCENRDDRVKVGVCR